MIKREDVVSEPVDLVLEPGTELFIDNRPKDGVRRVLVYDRDEIGTKDVYYADLKGVCQMLGREVTEVDLQECATLTAGPAEPRVRPEVDLSGLDRKALLALRCRIDNRLWDLEQDKHAAVVADMSMPPGWGDDATDRTDRTDGDDDA